MQICNHKQTNPKSARKSDLGGSWGSIWEGFGTLRAVMGPLLGAFWLLVGRSNSYLLKTWVQDGLQEAFWMAFESILGGFGPLLDTLGRLWAFFLAFKPELL